MNTEERVNDLLVRIYGRETGASVAREMATLLERYRGRIPAPKARGLSHKDAILITYPDQVEEPGRPTLATLADFCQQHLSGIVSGVHILPFFPWSSDDGFSVTDYRAVEPKYGGWSDIRQLGGNFRLMFDAVFNHASAQGAWFQGYLRGDPAFRDFFIQVTGHPDLSEVVRPRALPLLTKFDGVHGEEAIWTTFSADQVDLNYHNPKVLLEMLDILLFYVGQGAEFIRLDAIAYLWKEIGTPCIHLPQTHWIVQLMRAVLDDVAPHVMLITETNVPSVENLTYFGNGRDEAQLVYNFPLPPLVLYTLHKGDASILSKWASTLKLPSEQATFFNFLASHDGIGLNPARGILPESEIEALVLRTEERGGFVSMKANAAGTQSPYELNINYFDALDDNASGEALGIKIDRFVAAHAILMAFQGLPGIYFHSMFGSRGWPNGVKQTGNKRSINREKLARGQIEAELADRTSLRSQILGRLSRLLRLRAQNAFFAPDVPQRVMGNQNQVFGLLREKPGDGQAVLCLHNVTAREVLAELDLSATSLDGAAGLHDLIGGRSVQGGTGLSFRLGPYESAWLTNGATEES